jgi:hypothetical protein
MTSSRVLGPGAVLFVALLACAETSPAQKPGPKPATLAGGDGLSCATRVVVHAETESSGAEAEERWLLSNHPGHQRGLQRLGKCGETPVDVIRIQTSTGQSLDFYFDISEFAGRF